MRFRNLNGREDGDMDRAACSALALSLDQPFKAWEPLPDGAQTEAQPVRWWNGIVTGPGAWHLMESGEVAWFWRWVRSESDAVDGVAAVPIFVKQGACVCGHGYAAGECDYAECAHESAVEALMRASGEFVEHGQERAQPEELQVFERADSDDEARMASSAMADFWPSVAATLISEHNCATRWPAGREPGRRGRVGASRTIATCYAPRRLELPRESQDTRTSSRNMSAGALAPCLGASATWTERRACLGDPGCGRSWRGRDGCMRLQVRAGRCRLRYRRPDRRGERLGLGPAQDCDGTTGLVGSRRSD